jgi:hypothetical protein
MPACRAMIAAGLLVVNKIHFFLLHPPIQVKPDGSTLEKH